MTASTEAARLVAELTARLAPLEAALAEAWWESATHSSPDADRRRAAADLAWRAALADAEAFAALRSVRRALGANADALLRRQLDVLHDWHLPHQVPDDLRAQLVELETSVEARFNAFRAELDGEQVDDNALLDVLRTSDDVDRRRAAWTASKQIGAEVAQRVRELARVRNVAARRLGYRDHFALALATGELDETRLFATLREVEVETNRPFRTWKAALDDRLAKRFDCAVGELRPWHLDDPFFQDPPRDGAVDLDAVFAEQDLEALTVRTYESLGIDVRPVLARSDLYARDHKSQHAFCIDVDRGQDVRVLCNVEANERWMETMLHEFGHAVYELGFDPTLPWVLRMPAHPLTTEAVAMLMGRLVHDPEWLRTIAGVPPGEVDALTPRLALARRAARLVFARWVLVVTHFERTLYANPDADLDTSWWDLVERFQLLQRPDGRHEPDWAAKIHLAVVPVYYQNYLYGELFASQLAATLTADGQSVLRPRTGARLAHDIFAPGARQRWDELVRAATGEPLTPRHLARDLG